MYGAPILKGIERGITNWISQETKKKLEEAAGSKKKGPGRPREYFKIPVAVARQYGLEDFLEALMKGEVQVQVNPEPFREIGLNNVQIGGAETQTTRMVVVQTPKSEGIDSDKLLWIAIGGLIGLWLSSMFCSCPWSPGKR